MEKKFTIDNEEKYGLIRAEVEKLDTLSAPDLKSELLILIKGGQRNIIVDLSNTRYCDSSGLSALLTGNRLCKEVEGSFVIAGLQPAVEKLIQISQLTQVLSIVPTAEEAIDMVMMEEIERELKDEDEG
jgi:anti-anti-sigma factor